jgi:hypothetical protein
LYSKCILSNNCFLRNKETSCFSKEIKHNFEHIFPFVVLKSLGRGNR